MSIPAEPNPRLLLSSPLETPLTKFHPTFEKTFYLARRRTRTRILLTTAPSRSRVNHLAAYHAAMHCCDQPLRRTVRRMTKVSSATLRRCRLRFTIRRATGGCRARWR